MHSLRQLRVLNLLRRPVGKRLQLFGIPDNVHDVILYRRSDTLIFDVIQLILVNAALAYRVHNVGNMSRLLSRIGYSVREQLRISLRKLHVVGVDRKPFVRKPDSAEVRLPEFRPVLKSRALRSIGSRVHGNNELGIAQLRKQFLHLNIRVVNSDRVFNDRIDDFVHLFDDPHRVNALILLQTLSVNGVVVEHIVQIGYMRIKLLRRQLHTVPVDKNLLYRAYQRIPAQLSSVRKLQLLLQIVNILPQLFVLFLKRFQLTLCTFCKRIFQLRIVLIKRSNVVRC